MQDITLLLTLFGTMFLGAILPGPDMLIVIRNSLLFGRLRGIATAFGVATLMTSYSAVAVFFIDSIRQHYMLAFRILSCVGAIYLIYLAYKCFRNATTFRFGTLQASSGEVISMPKAYLLGALTNLLNPKAIVYVFSIMPFFTHATHSFAFNLSIVATVFAAVASCFVFVATMLSLQKVRDGFAKFSTYMEYLFSLLLFVFGIWVLVENIL
jgi:threonine/homoserine/homoserine lactone efflux protein